LLKIKIKYGGFLMNDNLNNPETNSDFDQTSVDSVTGVDKAPKKKTGMKIAAVSVAAVAVAAGGSALAYNLSDTVKNTVKLAMLKPDDYYAWVYEKNAEDQSDEISKAYSEYLEKYKNGTSASISLKYEASDSVKDYLLESIFGTSVDTSGNQEIETISNIINNIDSIELGIDAAAKEGTVLETIYGSLNGDKLASAEIAIDLDSYNYFARVPELTEKWIGVDMGSMMDELDSESQEVLDLIKDVTGDLESYISPDELSDLIRRYTAVWTENIKDVELEKKENISIGDVEVEYTVITAEINEEKAFDLCKAYIDEVSNDKMIKEIIIDKLDVCSEDEYNELFEELLEDFEDKKNVEFGDDVLTFVTYVDSTGTIRGYDMSMSDNFSVNCIYGADEDNIAGEMKFTNDGEEILSAVLDAEKDKDIYTGNIDCAVVDDYGDKTEFSIDFDDFEVVDEEKGYVNGNVAINVPGGVKVELELKADKKAQNIIYDADFGVMNLGTFTLSLSSDESAKVSMPETDDALMIDENISSLGLDDYVTESEMRNFINGICKKIGLPDEITSMLEDEMADELYGYSYDYDEDLDFDDDFSFDEDFMQ